ncbi:glycoside hydrolase family 43 protein [Pelagicoccus sp. SDUM812003]|uniref:glycoside hydrolase family 43 protein n=1 Tax=Pelagicoccus sp. SDUM812003 TaxID=3041267 RepID=UPI00280DBBE5|nr:glycoside hydrolase family 43 protein [Pelagicoccus sp. SDUM812003]MDQ8203221.1 glycoside hydrolase family 43 protein [Pelagicoccus sp. SDUM812003]
MTDTTYLFAYFTGNGQSGMHLAHSEDGLSWRPLSDKAYISPMQGLMRDPFLACGPDGVFRLVWTTDWESQEIGYASSRDLLHWSEQRKLPVMAEHPATRNCWAPEMVYDAIRSDYLIFWASTIEGRFINEGETSEDGYNHRMWSVRTKDFETFSSPEIFFDPGYSVIDATLLQLPDHTWRLICKDERLSPERKSLFVCQAPSPSGPFSKPSKPFTKAWVEGPACLQIDGWTHVYYDVYRDGRYEGKRTKDFETWEDISDRISFPEGARHGSIISAPRSLVDALQ